MKYIHFNTKTVADRCEQKSWIDVNSKVVKEIVADHGLLLSKIEHLACLIMLSKMNDTVLRCCLTYQLV